MLYYLFNYLHEFYNFPGAGMFSYLSFRAGMAIIMSLFLATVYGKKIINFLQKQQVGETVRELGLDGQVQKAGTPTMGGLIIIMATIVPVLLFAKLDNIYVIILLITTVWMGVIGFMDDYIKVFKKNKEGLRGIFKVVGQIGLGIIVGSMLYVNDDVVIREKISYSDHQLIEFEEQGVTPPVFGSDVKSMKTTIPFMKHNEFSYSSLIRWIGDDYRDFGWLIFIPMVIFIITAVSNGANLTDGVDGLAAGSSAIMGVTLAILAWVSGNIIFSDYLNIMFIPNSGEMTIFIASFIGALIGFLWYNSYPAQVFMGDTGSLTIGGIIAVIAIAVRKELLIPIISGVFLIENLSVVLQVAYFKYTKKKTGEGKRIFLMAPLHHHYQKKNIHESKIVIRFWIIGIILSVVSIITLKVR
ncbi:MAG: phospho-N-acetylmuramoyl-pentapeptide-transferase [Ichthyobacteriaceae bacterium]|nr:phospho-N-acetylmuramoyl-pentapeptide-transferase [Ichthyobacteriaceae bacterium]